MVAEFLGLSEMQGTAFFRADVDSSQTCRCELVYIVSAPTPASALTGPLCACCSTQAENGGGTEGEVCGLWSNILHRRPDQL